MGEDFLVPENVLLPEYSPPSSLIYGLVSIPSFPLIFKGTFLGFRKPLFFFFQEDLAFKSALNALREKSNLKSKSE